MQMIDLQILSQFIILMEIVQVKYQLQGIKDNYKYLSLFLILTRAHAHTHARAYTHTHTHTHIHTYIHKYIPAYYSKRIFYLEHERIHATRHIRM